MTDDHQLRRAVAAQLIAMSAPGNPLHTDADHNTSIRYAGDTRRFAFRKRVVGEYLDRQTPERGGFCGVVTAGAPGAGKSTALGEYGADLAGFRFLDPDIVKDYLIEQALIDGIFDDILSHPLDDGRTVAPRELAALVHHESTQLIDQIRRICIAQRENIVVEGTLSWKGLAPKLVTEFTEGEYRSVEILAIEADRDTCHEQALSRWWSGRRLWADGADRLGGRFTPPAAINLCYSDTESSLCTEHAVEFEELASATISHTHLAVLRRDNSGALETILERRHHRTD